MWPYLEKIPASIRDKWVEKLTAVSKALGVRPEWLMVVMWQESRLNPASKNGTVAVGLIQFTTSGAASIGTTKAEILKQGYVEQLDSVQKFFQNVMKSTGALRSLGEVYMATFLPSKVRVPLDTVLARKGQGIYAGNSGLDVSGDGILTKRDVVAFIHGKIPLEDRASVAFNPGGTPSSLAWNSAAGGDTTIYGEPDDSDNDSKGDINLKDEDYGQSGETKLTVTQTTWFPYVLVGMAVMVVALFAAVALRKPATYRTAAA